MEKEHDYAPTAAAGGVSPAAGGPALPPLLLPPARQAPTTSTVASCSNPPRRAAPTAGAGWGLAGEEDMMRRAGVSDAGGAPSPPPPVPLFQSITSSLAWHVGSVLPWTVEQPHVAFSLATGQPSPLDDGNTALELGLPFYKTNEEFQHILSSFGTMDEEHVSNESVMPTYEEFHIDDLDRCTTPKRGNDLPFCGASYTPMLEQVIKPVIGMVFDDLAAVEQFYKAYAHQVGFSVRLGPQKNYNDLILWKRYLCSKQGFSSEKKQSVVVSEETVQKKKRKYNRKITKCGCEAMIAVKRNEEGKYKIAIFIETHTHVLVSPSKQQFIRSNRMVSDKAKNALFTGHKAGIGTSGVYRLLHADAGGFENIGCTKKDLENFQQDLRYNIKLSDAQMFVDMLERMKLANPTFFYEIVVDDKGRLVHAFWADSTCKKNYALFGDVVSFDSTYRTNQYEMIFTPFTGVNHHMSCISFGAALIANEKIASYTWLFETFLKAMGGVAPRLIVTDEDASMKVAITNVFQGTTHRLCMWHIMKKLTEKVGASVPDFSYFKSRFNSCVWDSETPEEFESSWSAVISDFGLEGNEWLAKKFDMRKSWIPAFFKDLLMGGIMRTTSRSESANSYFRHFVGHKLSLVEFWSRFQIALETQRYQELAADNDNVVKIPQLKSSWRLEEHARNVFTHKVFSIFQDELLAARDKCAVRNTSREGCLVFAIIRDDSGKFREVLYDTSIMTAKCSCKFFESKGIPCRHIINVLKNEMLHELPSYFVLERWTKKATRKCIFDTDGHILGDQPSNSLDPAIRKLYSDIRKKMETGMRVAVQCVQKMECLKKIIFDGVDHIMQMGNEQSGEQDVEGFFGCSIPTHVDIHPPREIRTKGSSKRLKGGLEKAMAKTRRAPRICKSCNEKGHNSLNCPKKAL